MKERSWIALAFFLFVSVSAQPQTKPAAPHELLDAVLWMQASGEFKAATIQAFRVARLNLDRALQDPIAWPAAYGASTSTNYSIIVDIDETILDNSRFEATQIAKDARQFDTVIWNDWVARKESPAFEGAKDFLNYASSRGVTVYYVTNRSDPKGIDLIRDNLISAGFPVPTNDVLLVTGSAGTSGSDKDSRRQFVAGKSKVLLMLGDDLSDFFPTAGWDAAARRSATLA